MVHISVATAIQHLLFSFLAVVVPAWDYHDTRRLKQNPSSAGKIRYYKTVCAWLWIASTVACLSVGFRWLFTISPAPGEISWLFRTRVGSLSGGSSYCAYLYSFRSAAGRDCDLEKVEKDSAQILVSRCDEIAKLLLSRNLD